MAEQNVITSMLDDFAQERPIQTALCVGQDLSQITFHQSFEWHHFNVSELLNLPFHQRYDMAVVLLDTANMQLVNEKDLTQILVKLRDLLAKRLVVVAPPQHEKLLRALGLTQILDQGEQATDVAVWQFNIMTYKHVPDWFNSKFWANPENWNKFRW